MSDQHDHDHDHDHSHSSPNIPNIFTDWLGFPDPDHNIWHGHVHLFTGEEVLIQNKKEWYESPNVPSIYKEHKYIFKQNMNMGRPEETYYEQNVDSGEFASTMEVSESLPSGRGKLKIEVELSTGYPPSGENDFAMVEYVVNTYLSYNMPNGITFLPKIIANPLNRIFKRVFLKYIGEEMIEYDGEYARERTTEYFQYLRKYHGEEPAQTKTRQAEFKPAPKDGIFFQ